MDKHVLAATVWLNETIGPSDLKTLMEMGLIEMRDDAPTLNKVAHQALNR